ncbi:hypothetical protein JQ632_05975 [Bradyrhizobium liaoningense]|nr:hypothetical protein [Bradyrhizobium liaoningense]
MRFARRDRGDFAVEPILLLGKGRPGLRHPLITLEGRLAFGALREVQAVLGVIPKNVRLLHGEKVGRKKPIRNRSYEIVTSQRRSPTRAKVYNAWAAFQFLGGTPSEGCLFRNTWNFSHTNSLFAPG